MTTLNHLPSSPRPAAWKHERLCLKDKAVLITGGTTGIGRAILRLLASEGARVLTFGRHQQELNDALDDAQDLGGEVYGVVADQAREAELERVYTEVDRRLGGLDILIANAALAAESVATSELAQIRYVIETNLIGYLACAKLAVDRMKKQGGHIVTIGSMSALTREKESDIYVATKAGIQGFSEALRKLLNEQGIKVSHIEPGKVGSDMQAENGIPPQKQRRMIKKGEMLTAEDIAECVYYVLVQPQRCDVVSVQIRPHMQPI